MLRNYELAVCALALQASAATQRFPQASGIQIRTPSVMVHKDQPLPPYKLTHHLLSVLTVGDLP